MGLEENLIIAVLSSSLLASIVGSLLTRWYKIRSDKEIRKFLQKEKRFFDMLTNMDAFTIGKEDKAKKEKINEAYRQLWLYGSDETIRSINRFWISTGTKPSEEKDRTEADKRHCEMVLQIRKDFYGKTDLKPEEYLLVQIR
jgi:hypothetical protein